MEHEKMRNAIDETIICLSNKIMDYVNEGSYGAAIETTNALAELVSARAKLER